jgi:hypothetical protein
MRVAARAVIFNGMNLPTLRAVEVDRRYDAAASRQTRFRLPPAEKSGLQRFSSTLNPRQVRFRFFAPGVGKIANCLMERLMVPRGGGWQVRNFSGLRLPTR